MIVLGVGLRESLALGRRQLIELLEHGERLIQPAQAERHQAQRIQSAALQPIGPVRKNHPLGLFQQPVGQAQVAAAVLHLRRLERPGAGFQQWVTRGAAEFGDAGGLAGRIRKPALREEEVAQVAPRQDLALDMTRPLKPVS